MRDSDRFFSNDVIDKVNLTVPLVQTATFTQVKSTNGLYGITQFSLSYDIRYNLEQLPRNNSYAPCITSSCSCKIT